MLKRCVFNRLTIGMIPQSYLESLSYEEQVLWLQKNLNEVIILVNKLQEEFDNIDINFDELQHEIDSINEGILIINQNINELDANKANKSEVQQQLSDLELELKYLLANNYNTLKEYVDEQDEYLQYQIDHFNIDNITILDPTTGLYSPIQIVVDNIYDQTRDEAITAGEYDALELSAGDYDALEITAFNYDRYGKTILSEI